RVSTGVQFADRICFIFELLERLTPLFHIVFRGVGSRIEALGFSQVRKATKEVTFFLSNPPDDCVSCFPDSFMEFGSHLLHLLFSEFWSLRSARRGGHGGGRSLRAER